MDLGKFGGLDWSWQFWQVCKGLDKSWWVLVYLCSPFEVSASLNRFWGDSADLDRSWWVLGGLGESLGVSLVLGKSWWVLADLGRSWRVFTGYFRPH